MAGRRTRKKKPTGHSYRDPEGRISTTILLDRELHKALKHRAIDESTSLSELVERYCREGLKRGE